jgi:hydroxypyruvate isomerase
MPTRLKQAICRSRFEGTIEELARLCVESRIAGIDQAKPADWPALKREGVTCSLTPTHGVTKGLCVPRYHDECLRRISDAIELSSEAHYPNVVCYSGCTEGLEREEAIANCVSALKQVAGLAERKQVTICLELINSRKFPGYLCDRTKTGAEICRRVGSPRVKLLYDIYHMQIMEGNIIETIRENFECLAHFHTAGVPGRHELDENQELCYPAIMRAIRDLGFEGFVGHEFEPTSDPAASFSAAMRICDV